MRNLDVLFCTALDEESFVLDAWMRDEGAKVEELPDGLQVVDKKVGQAQLLIGLQFFGGMGNVSSAINLSRSLRQLQPRCVFLTGVAGGYHKVEATGSRYLEMGDVGYSTSIVYSSYSSIDEIPKKSIDLDLRPVDPVPASDSLSHLAGKVAKTTWSTIGKLWFKEYREAWIATTKYQKQTLYRSPSAHPVRIASGESVIKSTKFQDMVVKHYGKNILKETVRMFEMEAYGVASICKDYQVPFLVVKGICDLADKTKQDINRFRAICAATAFSTSIIAQDSFSKILSNLPQPDYSSKLPQCLHPRVASCPYAQTDSWSTKERPCINFQFSGTDLAPYEAHITRVFEGVDADDYSTALAEYFRNLLKPKPLGQTATSKTRGTLFFAYSPLDLLNYFSAKSNDLGFKGRVNSLLKELNEIEHKYSKNETSSQISWQDADFPWNKIQETFRQKIAIDVCEVALRARTQFRHFSELSKSCKRLLSSGFNKLAQSVCRVIICDFPVDKTWNNPTYIIYPALLDVFVPSFFANKNHMEKHLIVEDVNFIESQFDQEASFPDVQEITKVQALRFSANTETVIVSGKECKASGQSQTTHTLLHAITKWQEIRTNAGEAYGDFPRFPFIRLVQTHLPKNYLFREEIEEVIKKRAEFFLSPKEPQP